MEHRNVIVGVSAIDVIGLAATISTSSIGTDFSVPTEAILNLRGGIGFVSCGVSLGSGMLVSLWASASLHGLVIQTTMTNRGRERKGGGVREGRDMKRREVYRERERSIVCTYVHVCMHMFVNAVCLHTYVPTYVCTYVHVAVFLK